MSCPDTKAKKSAIQGGSNGAPATAPHLFYKSPEEALHAARRRRQSDKATRAAACQDPKWAFWYAKLVDRSHRDGTRAAACLDPQWAYHYAQKVDRSPRDDTRAAACRDPEQAFFYAQFVDQSPHVETLTAVKGSEYFQKYLKHFTGKIDELEARILTGQPYTHEELLLRADLIIKYGL